MNDLPARLEAEVERLAEAARPPWFTRTQEERDADNTLRDTFGGPGRPLATVKALVREHRITGHLSPGEFGVVNLMAYAVMGCKTCTLLRDYAKALGVEEQSDGS
jgi:hypothetical protein